MLPGWLIGLAAFGWLGALFAIAYYGDRAAERGRSIIANPYVYALSLAVYASAWTYYGSVGRAVGSGIGFLPIYLGPTVMATLWWLVLRKIIRIAKNNRITSLADFISSRYGKSAVLAGLVTTIAVLGITPYISLQLKAIDTSFNVLRHYPNIITATLVEPAPVAADTALYVALLLAAFTIVFGTRHLNAAERHEGMVAAIACESLLKLLAFLAVGLFVTYGMHDGFTDLFRKAAQLPQAKAVLVIGGGQADIYTSWASLFSLAFLSMMAILFLPRQFQMAVIENVDENHLKKAVWLFPLYLLLINIFVLPIALAGLLQFGGDAVNPDFFVLMLPMSSQQGMLTLLVFIGGFAAATGMVIVESIALSTMVCNDLVMPLLLRMKRLRLAERANLSGLLLAIRRATIVILMLFGYGYFRLAGEAYALVEIGLISFAAVAQFGPALLGGIYWKGATRAGALAGLAGGFLVWLYTLVLPAFARSGWLPIGFVDQGPFGLGLLRPQQLFGLSGLDEITHAMIWSTIANFGAYIGVSVATRQSAIEQAQAALFVDVFKPARSAEQAWRTSGSLAELHALLSRFLGPSGAMSTFTTYANRRGLDWPQQADADLVNEVETQLAGVIGAASARVMIASVIEEEPLRDNLTGLPNRAFLLERLNYALERAKLKNGSGYALLLLSVDRFHFVTDSFGHNAGEQLLIGIARRLDGSQLPGDTAARLDGARFAILLHNVQNAAQATRYAEQLQNTLSAAYDLNGHDMFVTVSIGIALSEPGHGAEAGDMLRDAETANHGAVARGGACIEIFEPDLRARVVAKLGMETMLRQAILKDGGFQVYYQPIVALNSGRLSGFEALVRMCRADGSLVPPAEFIPVSEESDLIVKIGRLVLTQACVQMCDWQRKFPQRMPLQISVNLAGRQFAHPNLMEQIEDVLKQTGLDTLSLKLEVTETVLMEHAEAAEAVLIKLHGKGIKLLMDDFGTGYSSLSYLHRFPVNTLKIDASFVRRMDVDPKSADIIRTIVALAKTLNMDLIAEGVETAAQLAQLRALEVEYGQGYYFGKPLDSAAAEAMIAAWPQW